MNENVMPKKENTHVCPHKFGFMLDNWIRRLFQNPTTILKEYINPGDTVMDIGCGPGFFTIDMAKIVGDKGSVFAVDLQEGMLKKVSKKADGHGVAGQVTCHQCRPDSIGLDVQADFILAFYMVHETPDMGAFLKEAKSMLKQEGRLLVVEPKMHVSKAAFEKMVEDGKRAGLMAVDFPSKKGGRSILFSR
jgi:ubiquinone/menaquinone biosynthesis C-methylase UbiE